MPWKSALLTQTSISFQLPDLLAQTNSFTFRTNKHTKRATDASESWLLGTVSPVISDDTHPPHLDTAEKQGLRGAKYGLLAGLSCPTCDSPQLRLLADTISLIFISHFRTITAGQESPWTQNSLLSSSSATGLEIFDAHPLFQSLTPQLRRAISALPAARQASWITKFTRSTRAFAKAQTRVSSNLSQGKTPSLAEYIICRREVFAASLFWDVVDLLDIVEQPTGRTALEQEKIALITQCAVDIVVWTIDIFAYASPTRCTTHNLISLLTRYKNLSVQAAMNYAGGMVRERLEEFHHLERTLLLLSGPATDDPQDATSSSWAARWIWALPSAIGLADTSGSQRDKRPYLSGIPFQAATEDGWCLGEMDQAEAATLEGGERSNEETKRDEAQLKRYVVALKDYILGSMHWGYETELYFGQKGEEIRSFGWVFLSNNVAT